MPASKKKQVVTAPLVRVENEQGQLVYLYAGAPLDGIKASEVDRLVELGMVGDSDEVVPGAATPDSVA